MSVHAYRAARAEGNTHDQAAAIHNVIANGNKGDVAALYAAAMAPRDAVADDTDRPEQTVNIMVNNYVTSTRRKW